ncbi:MAG: HAD hydrolase-like protein [Lachnospiraceae bacterium]|nr:HAD hydrolase-like protein [Lachnospiraceae bacterium]
MRRDYILFDLDGTLTDPKVGICTSAQYALADQGIVVEDIDDLTAFIGPPLQYSFRKFYQMDEEQIVRAVAKFRERMHDVGKFENEVYPGIPQMLRRLKAQGFHLAVASSKTEDMVKEILEHFGIARYFEAIVGSDPQAMDSSKEDLIADTLNRLFHYMRIRKDSVVMVGDRCFDVDAANNMGLISVGVRYGYAPQGELEESEPDYIVATVEELENLLLSKELQGEDFEVKEPEPEEEAEADEAQERAAGRMNSQASGTGSSSAGQMGSQASGTGSSVGQMDSQTSGTGGSADQMDSQASGTEDRATRRMDPKYFSTDDRKTGQTAAGGASAADSNQGRTQNAAGSNVGKQAAGQSGDWKADAKKKRSRSFQMVWSFLYPFLLFYVMGELARQLLGYAVLYISRGNDALFNFIFVLEDSDEEKLAFSGNGSAIVQILALIVVFFILYYMADGKKCLAAAKEKYGQNPQQKTFVWVVTTLLLALGINMFFIGTGLLTVSSSYQEAAANLYAVGIPLGIILYGFFSSTVEEFLFRGIILVQMDKYMKPTMALLLSALLFGIYHGNLVQGIYAFAIGAVLAMAYRDSGNFVLIAAIHGLVNVVVFLMSNLGLFPTGSAGITAGAVLIAMGLMCLDMVMKKEKASRSA